jgi:hypothetical protein
MAKKGPAEATIRDIKRKTRRKYSGVPFRLLNVVAHAAHFSRCIALSRPIFPCPITAWRLASVSP